MEVGSVCHCYCQAGKILGNQTQISCQQCGGMFLKSRFKSIKSSANAISIPIPPYKFFQSLRKATERKWKKITLSKDYIMIRKESLDHIQRLNDYFRFQKSTLALSAYLLDRLLTDRPQLIPNHILFSSASLLTASKINQIDYLVPFIPRLRKHSGLDYTQKQYKQAQRTILQHFRFEVNIPTHFDFLKGFLFGGVIFSNQKDCIQKFYRIQAQIQRLGVKLISAKWIHEVQPQRIAIAILIKARLAFGLQSNQIMKIYGASDKNFSNQVQLIQMASRSQALKLTDLNIKKDRKQPIQKSFISSRDQNSVPVHRLRV